MLKTIRLGFLALSYVWVKILEEPTVFLSQVASAFPKAETACKILLRIFKWLTPRKYSELEELLKLGEFDRFREAYQSSSALEKALAIGLLSRYKRDADDLGRRVASPVVARNSGELRVLYFVTSFFPYTQSGYTVRTQALVKSLSGLLPRLGIVTRLGYPLIIGKVPSPSKDMSENLLPRWMPFSASSRFKSACSLLEDICERDGITVLQTTTPFQNAQVVSAVAERLGIPWIYEFRGEPYNTWLSTFSPSETERARNSIRYSRSQAKELECAVRATAVITLSEVSKRYLIEHGISANSITVIPNAVEEKFFESPDRDLVRKIRAGLNAETKVLLGIISSLVAYEGIDIAIDAMKFLPRGYHLVIVGTGTEQKNLAKLAVELGLSDRVTFAGRQPNATMLEWYSAIDIFLVPRLDLEVCRNVTPIKPLPALALGVPIVASDLDALREVTGKYAYFAAPGSAVELARKIREAAESEAPIVAPREWLESRTWDNNATQLVELYFKLTSRKVTK